MVKTLATVVWARHCNEATDNDTSVDRQISQESTLICSECATP